MSKRAGAAAFVVALAFVLSDSVAAASVAGYEKGLAPTVLLFAFPVAAMIVVGYRTVWRAVRADGDAETDSRSATTVRWIWIAVVAGGLLGSGCGRLLASAAGLRPVLSHSDLVLFSLVYSAFVLIGALAGGALSRAVAGRDLPSSRILLGMGCLWLLAAVAEAVAAASGGEPMDGPILWLFVGWISISTWVVDATGE